MLASVELAYIAGALAGKQALWAWGCMQAWEELALACIGALVVVVGTGVSLLVGTPAS
jgi:CHASE2 domain-containing sensor protein